jgi:Glycosyl transferase 4-like domain
MFSTGVKHVANLCRYLPAAGWEPHILTKDWSEGAAPEDSPLGMTSQPLEGSPSLQHAATLPTTRAPYALRDNHWLRRLAFLDAELPARGGSRLQRLERRALRSAYPSFGHYPDMYRGWMEPAVEAGLVAVRQYGIGAVLSVCPPASSHLVGGEIARRAGISWVVLYSDLAEFYQGPGDGRSRRKAWKHRSLARRWLEGASRSACISPGMVDYVRETYGVNGDVVVVPFDPEERRVAPHRAAGAPMSIVHTGSLVPDDQRPQLLFDALDQMIALDAVGTDRLTVTFVGSGCDAWLTLQIDGRPCAAMIRMVDRVPPADAIRMQREADVLLTFNHENPMARASGGTLRYPSQMFEHWNASRPTVAVGADPVGFVGKLLTETGAGQTAEDAPSLSAVLLGFLAELRDTGSIAFHGDEAAISRYGAQEQAKRLASLLDAASAERFGSWQRARA